MKKSRLMPAGILALLLAGSGALVATAQVAPPPPQPDMHAERAGPHGDRFHRGGHGRFGHGDGGGEMFRTLFDTVDADGDGSVTGQEIDTYRAARVAEVDASGDGALSIEEFDTLYRQLTRPRMVDAFQELDADGDGVIGVDEMDTRVARLVERLDRDGDGNLTLQRPGGGD